MRINKFFSYFGYASRRKADSYIEEGRVLINGELATPGSRVSQEDNIVFDGKPLPWIEKKNIYYAYYKPRGVECTLNESVRNNLKDALNIKERVYPIGRLDKNSEGLLLLTNDGDKALELSHPRYEKEKEYLVSVEYPFTEKELEEIRSGLITDEESYLPCTIERISQFKYKFILKEGKNKQIRRICEFFDNPVKRLLRTRINDIYLKELSLKPGDLIDIEL